MQSVLKQIILTFCELFRMSPWQMFQKAILEIQNSLTRLLSAGEMPVFGAHRDKVSADFQGCRIVKQREPTSATLKTKSLTITAQFTRPAALRSLALDSASISVFPTADAVSDCLAADQSASEPNSALRQLNF